MGSVWTPPLARFATLAALGAARYETLRKLAGRQIARERPSRTLPTHWGRPAAYSAPGCPMYV